jgi:hypothetical protein
MNKVVRVWVKAKDWIRVWFWLTPSRTEVVLSVTVEPINYPAHLYGRDDTK